MEILVLNRQRSRRVAVRELQEFLAHLVAAYPPPREGSLAACLVSDRRIRAWNRMYRGRDEPTDVLSFPAGEEEDPDGSVHLGDIVISVDRAAAQAARRKHALDRELRILLLHGYLHLLGHDHETDDGAMLRIQRRLIRKLVPRREEAAP